MKLMQEFQKHIEQLSPVERQAAKILFEKVSLSLIDTNLTYDVTLDWASNVVQSKASSKYQTIVGDALDPKPFKTCTLLYIKNNEN